MPAVKRRVSVTAQGSPRYPVRVIDRPGPKSRSQYTPRSQRVMQSIGSMALNRPGRITRFGAGSKSAGKLKTGSTKKRYNKKYRKRAKFVNNGVTTIYETGGTVSTASDGECLYVGHTTSINIMKQTGWWAVLRALVAKANGRVDNFVQASVLTSIGFTVGDTISITGRTNANVSPTTMFTYTVAVGNDVNFLINSFQTAAALNDNDTVYEDLLLLPATGSIMNKSTIRLDQCYIEFDMKSDLKIQNRTVAVAADDTIDDVNNVPLYGKSYEGKSNGPQVMGIGNVGILSLKGNEDTGLIQHAVSFSGQRPFNEPLDYQRFKPVSKIGKIHLDPGQIKTSTILNKFKVGFNKFMQLINPTTGPTTPQSSGVRTNANFVKYRLFALEKMLDANPIASTTAVIVAVEHNLKIMARAVHYNRNATNYQFLKTRLQ